MKKFLSLTLILSLFVSLLGTTALVNAESEPLPTVYVTISDGNSLVVCYQAIEVRDMDDDGVLSVNDVLYCTHEQQYSGGAATGYGSISSDYGLMLTKLWGIENGGSYGYYVNNAAAMSLGDEVKDGDHVYAYVFTDLTTWSDTYCWFDTISSSVNIGDSLTLTLSCYTYDENFNAVVTPVKGATITVNGGSTEYKTDDNGKATIVIDKAGELTIGATSDTQILVPPFCKVTSSSGDTEANPVSVTDEAKADATDVQSNVDDEKGGSGNGTVIIICVIAAVVVIGAVIFVIVKKNKNK